ncbi:uncharacterized protein [Macrobrachium rosenbergii]|uniref:uncharacterized protein n=1 Tax=Macrobrachium rosenbergii TaxID=79674 RepID=UPI0034D7A69C
MANYVTKDIGGCSVLTKCMRRVRWTIEQRLITLLEGDMKENVASLCQKVKANLLDDILSITELAKAKVSGFDEVEAARIQKLVDASVMGPFSEKISAEVEKYSQEEQETIRENLREEYVDMLLKNYASALKNVPGRRGNKTEVPEKLREEVSESIDDFLKVCTKQHMIFIVEAKILQDVASDLTNHAASIMLPAKNTSSDGTELNEPSDELKMLMLKVLDKMLRMLGKELLTVTRIFVTLS